MASKDPFFASTSTESIGVISQDIRNLARNEDIQAAITQKLNRPKNNPPNRTLACMCSATNFYDINDLMNAFIGSGSLASYKPHVEGFETLHLVRKEYAITFRCDDRGAGTSRWLDSFHKLFKNGGIVTNDKNVRFEMRTKIPCPVLVLVTLYPVPIEIPDSVVLETIHDGKWGECSRLHRGVYDTFPEWKNGYVHAPIENIKRENVPPFTVICNKRVFISIQEEALIDLDLDFSSLPGGSGNGRLPPGGAYSANQQKVVKRKKLKKKSASHHRGNTTATGGGGGGTNARRPGLQGAEESESSMEPKSSTSSLTNNNSQR